MTIEHVTVDKTCVIMRKENVTVDRPYVRMTNDNVAVDKSYVIMRIEKRNCRQAIRHNEIKKSTC